jgi:hypothetical protein
VTAQKREQVQWYEIRVKGHLDTLWLDWFESLILTHEADGTSTLAGPLADQAALYGLLNRVRDLGLTLLSVHRRESDAEGSS